MKKAFITGITGQDGFFLTRLLLSKGYQIFGIARRNSQQTLGSLEFMSEEDLNKIDIFWGDITDNKFVDECIEKTQPDELYHLAAQSFVGLSFKVPKMTYDININGTLNIVNAVRDLSPKTKVYFAATSELYGKVKETPQNENTPFHPRSPYGVSKLAGFWTCKNYRESYDMFISNGILFNHESELRGPEFVTRKITRAVAKISLGDKKPLELGNMDAKRDWGHSYDFCEGMWRILQHDKPDDFVLATGKTYTVRQFVEFAFKAVDIEVEWSGEGIDEVGTNKATGDVVVKVNPEFFRPAEVDLLFGDPTKAKTELGWEPKIDLDKMVKLMVEFDINLFKNEKEKITLDY